MALLAKHNIRARPAVGSAAIARIATSNNRRVVVRSAASELLVGATLDGEKFPSSADGQPSSRHAGPQVETKDAVHVLSGESFESFIAAHDTVLVDYYTEW